MPGVVGFIGAIGVESENANQVWFNLRERPDSVEWVKVGQCPAWFMLELPTTSPSGNAALLKQMYRAMEDKLLVIVNHSSSLAEQWLLPGDCFRACDVNVVNAN